MRKDTTNNDNVRMTDVLCDFCHREWSDDIPMVEGHQGSCICGNCLRLAYVALRDGSGDLVTDFGCPLCLEASADRAALGREDEPGWPSPLYPDIVVCRRCVKQSAGVLHKDRDFNWTRPGRSMDEADQS